MKFSLPTTIFFGKEHYNEVLSILHSKQILLITSQSGSRLKDALIKSLLNDLLRTDAHIDCYPCISENPTLQEVNKVYDAVSSKQYDIILAIGGTSVIDSAKALSYMLATSDDLWYCIRNKVANCNIHGVPLMVINTTAGSGSEINCCAVIINGNNKMALVADGIFPQWVWIVPELMMSIPPNYTTYQFLDCIFHALEGFLSVHSSATSQEFSITCINLCIKHLSDSKVHTPSLEFRNDLALASLYSGLADMYGGCLSIHSLGHAISGQHPNIPHGLSIAFVACEYYKILLERADNILKARLTSLSTIFAHQLGVSTETALDKILREIFSQLKVFSYYGKALYDEKDIYSLIDNARVSVGELFDNDPIELSDGDMAKILLNSIRERGV